MGTYNQEPPPIRRGGQSRDSSQSFANICVPAQGYMKKIRKKPGTPEGYRAGLGGQKIRSGGQGRGLGIGKGRGPLKKRFSSSNGSLYV